MESSVTFRILLAVLALLAAVVAWKVFPRRRRPGPNAEWDLVDEKELEERDEVLEEDAADEPEDPERPARN